MKALTQRDVDHFLEHGYVVVRDAIDMQLADTWLNEVAKHFGVSLQSSEGWPSGILHLRGFPDVPKRSISCRESFPVLWDAISDLLGGEDRIDEPYSLSNNFIVNIDEGADRPWEPPTADSKGWHKDGDWFRHFLDSPEQALLTIICWKDIKHQGGGTFIAPDSIKVVAEYLAQHPEGIEPNRWKTEGPHFDFTALIKQCRRFEEFTAKAGDVCLMHPFMLHASSQNVVGEPRFITNPPVLLEEPFRYDRTDGSSYSAVERATLNALGVERLGFAPTRERLVSIGFPDFEFVSREEHRRRRREATKVS